MSLICFYSIYDYAVIVEECKNYFVIIRGDSACQKRHKRLEVIQYLVETQVVLDGVRGVEYGPTGSDNQDKTIESLWIKHTKTISRDIHCCCSENKEIM